MLLWIMNLDFAGTAGEAEAITVDHASHGRLELSIGAAWYDKEHHELGIPFSSTSRRCTDALTATCA